MRDSPKVHQVSLPQTQFSPPVWVQLTFLYPSTSMLLWFSTQGGRIGTTSMSLPLRGPPASTRIEGFNTSDVSDRLAILLSKKFSRQVFVSAHVPRQSGALQSGEDGSDEVVLRRVFEQVAALIRTEIQDEVASGVETLSLDQKCTRT